MSRQAEDSEIGLFQKLPTELRFMIWNHLIPEGHDEVHCRFFKTGLSILRANHRLYIEVSNYLYAEIAKSGFRITMKPDFFHGNYIKFADGAGRATWNLNWHPVTERLDRLHAVPWHRIGSLRVSLFRPSESDPGQIIYLWKQVLALVTELQKAPWVEHLTIRMNDCLPDKYNFWVASYMVSGNNPQFYEDLGRTCLRERRLTFLSKYIRGNLIDYKIVLLPFCLLRNIVRGIDVAASRKFFEHAERDSDFVKEFQDYVGGHSKTRRPPFLLQWTQKEYGSDLIKSTCREINSLMTDLMKQERMGNTARSLCTWGDLERLRRRPSR